MPATSPNDSPPEVSIIVPVYNEEKTIRLLLDAISRQTYPSDRTEVILADGNSTDGTVAEIRRWQQEHSLPEIRLVPNPKRIIPAGLNLAIQAAAGAFIIRMDAHCVPAEDYVERSVHALKADLGDNVGGRWEIRPGGDNWMARSIARAASSPLGVGDAKYRYSEEAGYADTVPFGAFRRETLLKLGGFDENLLTNEDYDLNVRIRKAGGKIWFDPQIRCIYFSRPDLISLARQYWRYGFWKPRMLAKAPDSLRPRQLIPPLFVLSLVILTIGQFFVPFFSTVLSLELIVYIMVLFSVAIRAAGPQDTDDPLVLIGMPLAIVVMHFCWGGGFLRNLIPAFTSREDPART